MPDPIIADQTQNPTLPTFPEIPDIPAVSEVVNTTPQASEPMDIPPMITNPKTPEKKSKRILLTILGIFLLIGAVGAGVVLVGQKQLFQQKASCPAGQLYCSCTSSTCCINACVNVSELASGCNTYINENCQSPTSPPSGGTCSNTGANDGCTGRSPGDTYCSPLPGGDGTPLLRTCYFVEPGTSNKMCGNTIGAACGSPTQEPTETPTPTPTAPLTGRQDYCASSTINKAEVNSGEEVAVSSTSNTNVNGFFYATYNSDNLYGPGNPKPVCTGTGSDSQCPNGGTPLIFSDLNNRTDGGGLRKFGSVKIPYANLFVVDKSTGQQVKSVQFNAYFSLNGGEWSVPNANCVVYVKATPASTPTPTPLPPIQLNCNSACYQMDASMECGQGLSCLNASNDPNTLILKCRNPQCQSQANCICSTPTPTPVPTATPTPSPTPAAMCSSVNAYDTSWNPLTGAQLSALSAESVVRFTISGTPADQIDKARFTINGVLKPETIDKKQGTNEYYYEYTIPAGVASFTVTAQIHHVTLGWF